MFKSQLIQKRRKNPPPRTNKNVLDALQMKIIHLLFPVPQLVVYGENISRLGCVTIIVQASDFLLFVKSKKDESSGNRCSGWSHNRFFLIPEGSTPVFNLETSPGR